MPETARQADTAGASPLSALQTFRQPVPPPAQCGGAGAKPRQNKQKVSPFPGVGRALFERGSGGWGQKPMPKQGKPGQRRGKPPFRHRNASGTRKSRNLRRQIPQNQISQKTR